VFTRSDSNSFHVYHVNLSREFRPEGDPKMLINESARSGQSGWTPDGSAIVLIRGAGFDTSLWRVRRSRSGLQPEKPERMAFAKQGVMHPAISRQGRLAYGEMSGDVDVWRLEVRDARPSEKPAVRLIASTSLDHDMRYSPDGTRIAFASTRSGSHEIWICDSNGENASQLTNIGSPFYTADARWSPDGQTIAFNSDVVEKRSAYLVNVSGGKTKRLDVGSIEGWSRDGKYIYMKLAANTKGLFKMPVTGGDLAEVPTKFFDRGALESPDGKYLYYEAYDGNAFTIRRLRLQDGDDIQLISSVNADNYAVASSGIYFIPNGPHPAIQFFSFADSKTSTIAKLPRTALYGFSLSPDERYLLYTQYEDRGSNLMLVENFH
jgi:WD40 repeat protein